LLNKGKMLKQFYDLGSEIFTFLEIKGKEVPELINDDWVYDPACLVDLTAYSNEPNLNLQDKNQLFHQLFSHVKTYYAKQCLCETQLYKLQHSTLQRHCLTM
jgi:hypothetical protein